MKGIYRVFNKETQKSYIGQSVNIHNRIFVHFHGYTIREAKSPLAKDMRENGKKAYGWEVLELCTSGEIDARETFWITALDSIHPNGYNLKLGGINGKIAKRYDKDRKLQLSLF